MIILSLNVTVDLFSRSNVGKFDGRQRLLKLQGQFILILKKASSVLRSFLEWFFPSFKLYTFYLLFFFLSWFFCGYIGVFWFVFCSLLYAFCWFFFFLACFNIRDCLKTSPENQSDCVIQSVCSDILLTDILIVVLFRLPLLTGDQPSWNGLFIIPHYFWSSQRYS